jgi:formylglycine-generating enzyme required for sulfatase activity
LAGNHLALLNKILPPAVLGPVPGRPWEIAHLGLKLVWIEPGTFLMGSATGNTYDRPVTCVTLTRGFWLGRTAVTQGQYQAAMGNNPSCFTAAGKNAPVEQVSWDHATKFCKLLTEGERAAGRLLASYEFTLPTEAQWEYACRAGTIDDYVRDLDAMAWHDKNSGGTTHPVATKQPNAWGLYDMQGNVWEWCLDWFESYPGDSTTDPTGPASGTVRVFRGGGWGLENANLAARNCVSPNFGFPYLGFRIALSSVP